MEMMSSPTEQPRAAAPGHRKAFLPAMLLVCAALVLAACGGGESTSSVNAEGVPISGGFPFEASTGTSDLNEVPAVNVVDLSDGSVVNLASAVPDERTTVFWFWAPH